MTNGIDRNHKDTPIEDVICFKDGLLGLEHLKKYVLLSPEEDLPFKYLQSIEEDNLALAVINPYLYMSDYSFDIYGDVIDELEIKESSDVLVINVVVIPDDIKKMTANFIAPILINVNNKKGKQIVLNDAKYQIRHSIFDEFQSIISQGADKC